MQIIQQPPTLPDQLQEAAAGTVIFLVALKMLGQVVDALRKQRNLHVGRSGILLVQLE